MNTNILKPIRWGALVLCCVLLNTARAQEVEPPTTPPAAVDAAVDAAGAAADAAADVHDDDAPVPPDSDSTGSHRSHRKHHGNHNDEVVSVGHRADLAAGQHAGTVVAVFGSATSAGDVDDTVVSIMGNTRVTGGRVGDTVVAVLGSVYVNGQVDGDVVAVMGNVELGPEARVRGDVIVIGGELTRDPAATIGGGVQRVFNTDWVDFEWLRPWVEKCLLYGRPLAFAHGLGWAWTLALGLLALYVVIAFLFRRAVDRCVQTLEANPGHSILAALLTILLTPVLIVLLCITVLGIAAIPFLLFALFCGAVFGKVVVLASIGRRCTPMLAGDPVMHTVVGVVVGGAIALVLYTIPVIGFIVYKLLGLLGMGVVMYTLLVAVRTGRQARAATAQGPNGIGPGVGPGGMGPGVGPGGAGGGPGSVPSAGPGFGAGTGATADAVSPGAGASAMPPGAGPGPGSNTRSAGFESTMNSTSNFGDFSAGPGMGAGSTPPPAGPPPGMGAAAGATGPGPHGTSPTSLPRAGFGIRMGALLLDVILVGILLHTIHEGTRFELIVLATYGAIMWKLKGSTVGGIICGLQVVRLDGRPIDWPTAIVRALSCFLSLAVVGLGFLWIAIDSDRQSWHDKIAGTVVVRAPKGASLL